VSSVFFFQARQSTFSGGVNKNNLPAGRQVKLLKFYGNEKATCYLMAPHFLTY
jgi:hypothetical protein